MNHRFTLIFFTLAILTSCEQGHRQSQAEHQAALDSFTRAMYGESAAEHVQKVIDSDIAKALLDTVGLYKAPVKIIKARMVRQDYSNYRNIYYLIRMYQGRQYKV